ncbi:cell division cycle and apoptosis regulator protein 1-like isoform X3 [Centruroides sculpturatus]|nr:cell division cycle and apoptosis regulator protein 1-like isoform X3 [Centruroides sculpturatus]
MPFKWNATRIQVLPNQLNVLPSACNRSMLAAANTLAANPNVSAAGTAMTLALTQGIQNNIAAMVCQPASVQNTFRNVSQLGQSIGPSRISNSLPSRRHSPPLIRRDRERERENRRDERRDRFRDREYDRDRYSPIPSRKRSHSPKRTSHSPARRRPRIIIPKYSVQLPKISLDMKEGNVTEFRKRYTNMYIPSDFCNAHILWQEAFPPHQPFSLDHPCTFHVMHKDLNPLKENDAVLEPNDADYLFSAKVMLISVPPIKEMYKKCCALAEDSEDAKETHVHPTRLINFLVGLKGKKETVAIGGPWSPSLDGPNPEEDPCVLIRTAIRTCKALTGVDLSGCSQCVVKGSAPKVGERVLVEAAYNPNMPFKWNATRIQVLPNQLNVLPSACNRSMLAAANTLAANPNVSAAGTAMTLALTQGIQNNIAAMVCQPASVQNTFRNVSQLGQSIGPSRISNSLPSRRHSPPLIRRDRERERENRRDERRDRFRDREYDRDRYSPIPSRKRSHSPKRTSHSPARRRPRIIIPKYSVQLPKISLDMKEGNVTEFRKRYTNMYIPSDFCNAHILWQEAFPPHQPFSLDHPCTFHVMHKDLNPLKENDAVLEPNDADYLFSAKVMLISVPPIKEMYKKCCALAEDSEDAKETHVHPTRLINFLVGLKGKKETVAIGGPWSPSLDGPNPEEDPCVLIRTAIRTCKALTGVDLSGCSQWYRFVEIYYHRGESAHKGRVVPARVETVVIFLPDVWSCLPTRLEWDGLTNSYKKQLQKNLHEEMEDGNEIQEEETNHEEEDEEGKKEPTHHSELDPKTMKVNDLRSELDARNMSTKGLKSQLIARLSKALKIELEREEKQESDHPLEIDEQGEDADKKETDDTEDERKKEEDARKQTDKKDQVSLDEYYQLPETPSIIIHPSKTAKNGKFDCTVMSLSVLLDYRQADNKEHSFEVSLFAELFNEMLMRDFGFTIYYKLAEIPEPKNEKEETHKKKDEKDYGSDHEEESDEDEDKEKRKKKHKKKQTCTVDPSLLLACIYFDQTYCGYILEKDLEELLYMIGLKLSRSQVRKILQKTCKREMFYYRKITDRPLNESVNTQHSKDETVLTYIKKLSTENRKFFPVFKTKQTEPNKNISIKQECLTNGTTDKDKNNNNDQDDSSPIVFYQGTVVDIQKLVQQLVKREKACTEAEQRLRELELQLKEMQEKVRVSENQNNKANMDLIEQQQKLKNTEEELKKVQSQSEKYRKALSNCQDQLHSLHSSVQSVLRRSSSRSGSSYSSDTRNDNSTIQLKEETKSDN